MEENNRVVEEQGVVNEVVDERMEAGQEEKQQPIEELKHPKTVGYIQSKAMNRYGLVLSMVLLVAVLVLYILFFMKKEKSPTIAAVAKSENASLILTINNDSIVEHFVLVKLLKSDLEKEAAKYQAELQRESAKFEEKYRNFETNYQNNVLTQTQIENTKIVLMKENARLEELSAKYTEIIARKEISVHREIIDSITNATKRINDAFYHADYVFATSENTAIFYANPIYDITAQVIEELNNTYNKTHKK